MADMGQMKMKVDKYRTDIEKIDEQIDKHHMAINKLREDKEKLQKQVDDITGVQNEESDAGITTTTAGNVSKLGGKGNYAPKIGMIMKRKKKKKKNENAAIDYLDTLLEE